MKTCVICDGDSDYSTFLLFPFGAGLILGVYVTVRVTISLT